MLRIEFVPLPPGQSVKVVREIPCHACGVMVQSGITETGPDHGKRVVVHAMPLCSTWMLASANPVDYLAKLLENAPVYGEKAAEPVPEMKQLPAPKEKKRKIFTARKRRPWEK